MKNGAHEGLDEKSGPFSRAEICREAEKIESLLSNLICCGKIIYQLLHSLIPCIRGTKVIIFSLRWFAAAFVKPS